MSEKTKPEGLTKEELEGVSGRVFEIDGVAGASPSEIVVTKPALQDILISG
jgi:hypothetical protein